jgi:hypothetical protein
MYSINEGRVINRMFGNFVVLPGYGVSFIGSFRHFGFWILFFQSGGLMYMVLSFGSFSIANWIWDAIHGSFSGMIMLGGSFLGSFVVG